jgi:replicative DNA helicase
MHNNRLEGALQENILTLLVYNKDVVDVIINNVPVELFSSTPYRDIAEQAVNFYREYKHPISDHLPDTLEHILNGADKEKGELYKNIIIKLFNSKDSVNSDFVMDTLSSFIRQQNLISSIKKSSKLVLSGKLDEAENEILALSRNNELTTFDAGVNFDDLSTLKFFNKEKIEQEFSSGIEALDRLGAYPSRKQLFTLMAMTNVGKSFGAVQIGKHAVMRKQKVVHITLEMPEEEVEERYLSAFFAIAKEETITELPVFEKNADGVCVGLDSRTLQAKLRYNLPDIEEVVTKRLKGMNGIPLRVKGFPSASLTIAKLKGYIENLIYTGFTPDMIIIDSPDLMDISPANYRMELGMIWKKLRGMADEYNVAMICLLQSNKLGKHQFWLDETNAAEDFSIARISDIIITLNRTRWEEEMNFARCLIAKHRTRSKKVNKIMIIQNYEMGQFCIDSVIMNKDLRKQVVEGNRELKGEDKNE